MIGGNQLYELAQIREQEYMLDAQLRSGRGRRQTIRLIAGAARRLRRRASARQD
jgi:hypothetical protein